MSRRAAMAFAVVVLPDPELPTTRMRFMLRRSLAWERSGHADNNEEMRAQAVGSTVPGTALARRVVGRERELAQLSAALDAAGEGRGAVVFLAGEAGIGKSCLTQTVAAEAVDSRGFSVLRGRAVPAAAPVPYRPLAEALCSAVRSDPEVGGADLDPYREILGLLVPEWRVERGESINESVVAVAEAVLRLLRATAADRGCLLVLEDLHWSDPETLRICEYLADNLMSERVLCVATLRTDESSAGFALARSLHARRVSPVVEIPRLTRFELAEMVGSCLETPNVADALVEFAARADGIPFLVEELLAAGVNSGALVRDGDSWEVSEDLDHLVPLTFVDGMRRRLATLGEDTRALLNAAAVLGRRFDWALLPSMTGRTDDEVLADLRRAIDAQVVAVDEGGSSFRFRHALSRDAVMAQLLPPEVAGLARGALEAVEATHPELEDEWCELAAELAERSGQSERAGRLLLEAARRALRRGALTSAESNLEQARAVLADDDLLRIDVDELLAQVLSLAGKREQAVTVGGSLLARLGTGADAQRRRSEVYLRLARAAMAATEADEADELLDRASAEMVATADVVFQTRIDAVRAQVAMARDPDRAPAMAEAALEAAGRLGLPEVACEALEVLGRTRRPNDLAAAEATFARALSVAEEHGLTLWRARALHELGTIDLLRGGSVERLEEARQLAVQQGALATAAVVDVQIAAALAVRDDPEPALEATGRSIELARRYGLHQTLAAALALEAHVHARRGRSEEMKRCIDEARALAPGLPDVEVKAALSRSILALVEDDRAAALRHLSGTVVADPTRRGGDYAVSPGAGLLALVRQLVGDEADADSGFAAGVVHFMARAFLLYATAVSAGRAGDGERAVALVAEADATLGEHRWLGQLGRRLVAEAAIADGWGDPVAWLRESLAFFDNRGEEQLASACRSLLRQAGAPVPRRRGDEIVPGPLRALGVTSREFEVLRLLALGLPNKKIGARLYLSPRTVERHVANLSTKTGVAARSELVAYAARTIGQTEAG